MGIFDLILGKKAPATTKRSQPVESPEEKRAGELKNFLYYTLRYSESGHPYSRVRGLDVGGPLGISGVESLLALTPDDVRAKLNIPARQGAASVEEVLEVITTDQQSIGKFLNACNGTEGIGKAVTEELVKPWLNYSVYLGYTTGGRPENFPDYRTADLKAKANPEAMKKVFTLALKHLALTPFSAMTIDNLAYIPYGSQHGVPKEVANDADFLSGVSKQLLTNLEQGVFLPWADAILSGTTMGLVPTATNYDFKTDLLCYSFNRIEQAAREVVKQYLVSRDAIVARKFDAAKNPGRV